MTVWRTAVVLCALVGSVLMVGMMQASEQANAVEPREPMIVHDVYFTLTDPSPAAKQALVDACDEYLTGHDGVVFYTAGVLADDLDRSVNDRDWHVGLHVVFKNVKYHDQYQEHPRHKKFIEEMRENWAKVRVFDSHVDRVRL